MGLLGGMSWESTALYYRLINEGIRARLGSLHSAKIVMVSVDFHDIEALQRQGNWQAAGEQLAQAAQAVAAAGADFLVICTNTMHKVVPQIESGLAIPLLHIADATAQAIVQQGIQTVGLLGTRFTMEEDFYKGRLVDRYGLQVQVPSPADRQIIHRVIYEELCLGVVRADSRQEYCRIVEDLRSQGAEGIIEGCTEIGLLLQQSDVNLPLFDTTGIHAACAVEWALA